MGSWDVDCGTTESPIKRGGNKMIVYHGSQEKFDEFDYKEMGKNGTSEGKGFYFTDNKNIAIGYGQQDGYLYTVEFNGQKPLNNNKKTITKEQLAKYLLELDKVTNYLSNWGDKYSDGLEKLLNEATISELEGSDNDADLISGICSSSGNIRVALNLIYTLYGYDSIIVEDAEWGGNQKIYIALVSDIVEIKSREIIR